MKFFLISNMYPSPESPGFGVFVKNASEGLDANGIGFAKGAVIYGKSKGNWSKLVKYGKFFTNILRGYFSEYDFIYIHFPNQMIPLLNLLFKLRRRKIFVNFHGEDLLYSSGKIHRWLGKSMEKFCRRYATGIVVPSQYFADIVARKQLIAENRIIVSPSGGINEDFFTPKGMDTLDDTIKRPLHIGYVGRLEPGKGIMEFLEVVNRLKEINIEYKATVVGYGSLSTVVESYIAGHNLGDLVTMVGGVPQSELARYYREFDLLVFLSNRAEESLGLTGIESMACGTPVIGSNVAGIPSYLEDGKNGFLIDDISDVDHIAQVIKDYKNSSKEIRMAIYGNAVETGARYFSNDVCRKLVSDIKRVATL